MSAPLLAAHGEPDQADPHIVIIGGGFSGAVVALNIARTIARPVRLTLVEPRGWIGGGVAYSSVDPAHRINVPATRMSVYSKDEGHFDAWVRTNGAVAGDPAATLPDGRIFPRRGVFGAYVQSELVAALQGTQVDFEHVRDRAVSARREGDLWILGLGRGGEIAADIVVLAASHPPPSAPRAFEDLLAHPRLILDPWSQTALAGIDANDDVLIVGTGLTMADIVASLDRRGHVGRIHAVSRRGLLSRSHADIPVDPVGDFASAPSRTALALLRRVRGNIASAAEAGLPWQAVIDAVRADAFEIWKALDTAEKQRLLRHLRVFWDVHRYRVAPQVGGVIERRLKEGTLAVTRGSIRSSHARLDGIETRIFDRARQIEFGISSNVVVLATGPAHGALFERDGLFSTLRDGGHVRADVFGIGIEVDLRSRAVSAAGNAHDTLFVAGPLSRGTFGELMGLPQVTRSAEAVASGLAEVLAQKFPAQRKQPAR